MRAVRPVHAAAVHPHCPSILHQSYCVTKYQSMIGGPMLPQTMQSHAAHAGYPCTARAALQESSFDSIRPSGADTMSDSFYYVICLSPTVLCSACLCLRRTSSTAASPRVPTPCPTPFTDVMCLPPSTVSGEQVRQQQALGCGHHVQLEQHRILRGRARPWGGDLRSMRGSM